MSETRLVPGTVVAERGRTSMRMEPEMWAALKEISELEGCDVSTLVRMAEIGSPAGSRTSAVRVFIVNYLRTAVANKGK